MLSLSQLLIFVAIAGGLAVIATLAATFFTVEQRTTAIVQESVKYRGAPLRHGPQRDTLLAWNSHTTYTISTNSALCCEGSAR
jgi:hypothetical protein